MLALHRLQFCLWTAFSPAEAGTTKKKTIKLQKDGYTFSG